MIETPSTIGLVILFLAIFAGCILWATRGHPADADNEDLSVVVIDGGGGIRAQPRSRS